LRDRAFLSHRLSAFLKIFEAIFCVETIVFGLAFLIDKLGFWPKAYADYTLPDSLPFAVALFGVVVYALSFISVVRKMTTVADPYFEAATPRGRKFGVCPPSRRRKTESPPPVSSSSSSSTKWKWRSTCGFPISAPISPTP